jgi:hypothetical protein
MDRSAEASLRLLDQLLTERPDRVGEDFSEATRWIAAYRDALIATWRRTGSATDRQRLGKINAVLSVVLGGHYPLAGIPWDSIAQARDQLAVVASGETV